MSALIAGGALSAFAGCSGYTTGASDISLQPDGTYSAKLNVIGSCDNGSRATPCTAYTQWRKAGTKAWTKGPTVTIPKQVEKERGSQTAEGLAPDTNYEYQLCGKEFADKEVTCAGDTGSNDVDPFHTGSASNGVAQAPNKPATKQQPGKGSSPAPEAGSPSRATSPTSVREPSNPDADESGSSPLVPIGIGLGTAALVVGATSLAARRFIW